METITKKYYESIASTMFRVTFQARADRESDPGAALEAARAEASALIPAWMTGRFDDTTLSFTADADETVCLALDEMDA